MKASWRTIRRTLRRFGYSWHRIRRSLKGKPDEQAFAKAKRYLERLKEREDKGELDLYFGDEVGFCLNPPIRYGWQKNDEPVRVFPQTHGKRLNVLGFMRRNNTLLSWMVEGRINSHEVIGCIDRFVSGLRKPTVLVLDNATIHRSQQVQAKRREWRQHGLRLVFLPPYSPELNPIEILWKQFKYYWLPSQAYEGFESLKDHVQNILKNFGKKYRITFV